MPNFNPTSSATTFNRMSGVLYPTVGYASSLYADTTAANLNPYIKNIPLSEIGTSSDGKTWRRNYACTKWEECLVGTISGSGTLTNITATNNYGQVWTITNPATTPNLSLVLDTTLFSTRLWRQKGVDSLQANINLKLNISDTSTMLLPYLRTANDLSPLFTTSESSHNISFSQVSQSQNLVFASPNGSSGNPTFRALVAGDLPGTSPYGIDDVLAVAQMFTDNRIIDLNGNELNIQTVIAGNATQFKIEDGNVFGYTQNISTGTETALQIQQDIFEAYTSHGGDYASTRAEYVSSDLSAALVIHPLSSINYGVNVSRNIGGVKIGKAVGINNNNFRGIRIDSLWGVFIDSLTNLTTQDQLVGIVNSSGQLGQLTLGTGGSINSGVLNFTGTGWESPLTFPSGLTRTVNAVTLGGPVTAHILLSSAVGYNFHHIDTTASATALHKISGKTAGGSQSHVLEVNDYRTATIIRPLSLITPNQQIGQYSYLQMGKIIGTDNGFLAHYYHGLNNDSSAILLGFSNGTNTLRFFRNGTAAINTQYPTGYTFSVTGSLYTTAGVRFSGIGTTEQAFLLMADVDGNVHRVDTTGLLGDGGGYTDLTQFVAQTAWRSFYSDGSGDVQELAFGTSGKVLTSNGASAAPTWETPAAGGITVGTTTITSGTDTRVPVNDGGVYGEDAGLVFNKTTDQLTAGILKSTTNVLLGSAGVVNFGNGLQTITHSGASKLTIQTSGADDTLELRTVSTNRAVLSVAAPSYAAEVIVSAAGTSGTIGAFSGTTGLSFVGTGYISNSTNQINIVPTASVFNQNSNDVDFQVKSDGDDYAILVDASANNVGISKSVPTARLHIGAGTATAGSAPKKYTAGTLLTVIEPLTREANASSLYGSTVALNRYAEGGAIKDFIATVDNVGTGETDLFTYTTKASTLAADGEKLTFNIGGTFNDLTATAQLQFYFGGTSIGNTGALTVSATGGWSANVLAIRTSSTTVRTLVTVTTPGASTAVYTTQTDLTGLTLSGTNIIKITGTAAGASGGNGDISAKMGVIYWNGAANN